MKPSRSNRTLPGHYAKVGLTLQIVGEEFAERMDMTPGHTVLDVATGKGNAALAFSRRGTQVTSTGYFEKLLMDGQNRATAEGLAIDFQMADAQALPLEHDSYDTTVFTFSVMFTPINRNLPVNCYVSPSLTVVLALPIGHPTA